MFAPIAIAMENLAREIEREDTPYANLAETNAEWNLKCHHDVSCILLLNLYTNTWKLTKMSMNKHETLVLNELINRVETLQKVVFSYQIVLANLPNILRSRLPDWERFAIPQPLPKVEVAPQPPGFEWTEG